MGSERLPGTLGLRYWGTGPRGGRSAGITAKQVRRGLGVRLVGSAVVAAAGVMKGASL